MADIEKVTKGLQYCTKTDGNQCPKCPYFDGECTEELSKDALELLKEYAVVKESISDEIHETAKMFRRTAGDNEIPLKW